MRKLLLQKQKEAEFIEKAYKYFFYPSLYSLYLLSKRTKNGKLIANLLREWVTHNQPRGFCNNAPSRTICKAVWCGLRDLPLATSNFEDVLEENFNNPYVDFLYDFMWYGTGDLNELSRYSKEKTNPRERKGTAKRAFRRN